MLHNLSIGELADRLGKRQISSAELTQHFLGRIERLNPALNAMITLTAKQALADAVSESDNHEKYQRNAPAVTAGLYVVPRVIE